MLTYRDLLQTSRNILKQQGIADADVDAWYLMEYAFLMTRSDYLRRAEEPVPENEQTTYLKLVDQRAAHIPLQHITGSQEFMGLEFNVSKDVLIPRQDTESLVEEVLKVCKGKTVLDMCTGSGCIIISLTKLGGLTYASGVDISEKALKLARQNAKKLDAEVDFIQSDLFEEVKECYDIIVSNPPYIPTLEIPKLMPEVKEHEPALALDGLEDGLFFYRRISSDAKKYLKKEGYLFFEIGHDQATKVRELLMKDGYSQISIKKDLSGNDRVVVARN